MTTTPGLPAVVTAAGNGTRFRPFTRHVPKEMLPIGAQPALRHVITECLAAGADQVYIVTRPDDLVVPAYTATLAGEGLPVRAIAEDPTFGYGNAAPLLTLSSALAGAELFFVAFGDDVLLEDQPGTALGTMLDLARSDDVDAVVAAQLVPHDQIGSFGAAEVTTVGGDHVARIRQRPDPSTVDEPLAVVSRLVLRPPILTRLTARPETGGEIDLGLAVGEMARVADVRVHRLAGHWVTVGEPRRYAEALQLWHEHTTASHTASTRTASGDNAAC